MKKKPIKMTYKQFDSDNQNQNDSQNMSSTNLLKDEEKQKPSDEQKSDQIKPQIKKKVSRNLKHEFVSIKNTNSTQQQQTIRETSNHHSLMNTYERNDEIVNKIYNYNQRLIQQEQNQQLNSNNDEDDIAQRM